MCVVNSEMKWTTRKPGNAGVVLNLRSLKGSRRIYGAVNVRPTNSPFHICCYRSVVWGKKKEH